MNNMAGQISEVGGVVISLNEIQADITVPRKVRTKIENVIATLKQDIELSIRVNKALNALDELSNDINLQAYTRTQIWNVISVLGQL